MNNLDSWTNAQRVEAMKRWDALLSSPPPVTYRDGDIIVTPGYQSSQGASSMCTCELCRPRYGDFSMPSSSPFSDPSRWTLDFTTSNVANSSPWNIKIDLGSSKPKEQPMSSTAQRVIADLSELEESELSRISRETERIKESRRESIEEDLDGVARMALRDKSTQKLRPFVISYFKDGKVSTAHGVELGASNLVKEEDEGKEYRVYVFSRDYPVGDTAYTMKRYEKALKESNIPYALIYTEDVE